MFGLVPKGKEEKLYRAPPFHLVCVKYGPQQMGGVPLISLESKQQRELSNKNTHTHTILPLFSSLSLAFVDQSEGQRRFSAAHTRSICPRFGIAWKRGNMGMESNWGPFDGHHPAKLCPPKNCDGVPTINIHMTIAFSAFKCPRVKKSKRSLGWSCDSRSLHG